MAEGPKGAAFNVSVEGNAATAGKEIATSAVAAAQAMMRLDDETKALSTDFRKLRGNSTEVVAEKKALRAKLDELRATSTLLALSIRKQGSTFTEAAAAAKKAESMKAEAVAEAAKQITKTNEEARKKAEELEKAKTDALKKGEDKRKAILDKSKARTDKRRDAQKERGGIVGTALKARDLHSRFREMTEATGSKGGALKAMIGEARLGTTALQGIESGAGMAARGLVSLGASAAAMGAAAVVAIGAAAVALVGFGIASSAAAQKLERQREALLGNAKDAQAFGSQIDALAGKVPQGVDELNGLAVSLSKTRLTGRAMVDTMNAVAQATGAVDAAAGQKLQEIITRGQNSGRMQLGKRELQGTGIDFNDVAREYAAGTKKSLAAAQRELSSGRAPLEAGAEAIRKATEKKFGAINKKNAFDPIEGPKKIMQAFTKLSSGLDLSPLTEGFEQLYTALSPDAPLGSAIKWMIETLGGGFISVAKDAIPSVIEGFKWLMVGGLKLYTLFYQVKKSLTDAFDVGGWKGLGAQIIAGLVEGIKANVGATVAAVKFVATKIKEAFTGKEGIDSHSPSKVFERYGKFTTDGYVEGVDKGAPKAREAVVRLAGSAKSGGAEGVRSAGSQAGGAGGSPEFHLYFGTQTPQQVAASQPVLESITKVIVDAYKSAAMAQRSAA